MKREISFKSFCLCVISAIIGTSIIPLVYDGRLDMSAIVNILLDMSLLYFLWGKKVQ